MTDAAAETTGPATLADVVIVNWNAGPLLRECLAALGQSTVADRLRAVVVDNASTDASVDGFEREPSLRRLRLTLLRNSDNRGFGAASNQGAAAGSSAFVLFLNPDTRVEPDAIEAALRFLAEPANADVGVLGVRLRDAAGATQRTCARRPTVPRLLAQAAALDRVLPRAFPPHFMTEWDHADTRPVDQVMGAFLLVRRPLLERLGGFDERFFVYYEDVDLCARARDAGWRVVHFAGAAAWHKGGGTSEQVKDRRLFYLLRSQVHYAAKHQGRPAAALLLLALLGVQVPLRTLHAAAATRSLAAAGQVLRGAALLCRDLPGLLPKLRRLA